MATKALVPVDEYLRTHYGDPDREYVGGRILERNLPDYLHGRTQQRLSMLLGRLEERGLPLFPCLETRMRVSGSRFRIPDVAVFCPKQPSNDVPIEPPYIAIEILSPDEREAEPEEKLKDYESWRVPHTWVADPRRKKLFAYQNGTLAETSEFTLPQFGLTITPADIWP